MKVGIVNDQQLATEALRRIVTSVPEHQVLWTAVDGRDAVHKCAAATPDAILMDLVMPVMDGAEATRLIMQTAPCPILVVTATVSGNYALVCEALRHGAYDAICTPVLGDQPPQVAGKHLLDKLGALRQMQAESAAPGRALPRTTTPAAPRLAQPAAPRRHAPLVALGASTGGPQALERLLAAWPASYPAAVVIVQHIAREFADSLVQWLQQRSALRIRAAQPGDRPEPGTALVAATNDHLVVRADGALDYRVEPAHNPFRPSVDVLFATLGEHWPVPGVAAVLSGIGRDGAQGLLQLRRRGWHTVAQDEGTSIVYGMPHAAAELGAAERILPIGEIGPHIARHVARVA